jgi:hypothetical protein
MSFRVIMKGTPSPRMIDVECRSCGELFEDLWKDDFEASDKKCRVCENGSMVEVFRRSAHTDFHDTKPIFVPGFRKGHQHFTSHIAMERYAKENGKVVIDNASKWEQLPVDTPEDRIDRHEKETGARQRALNKARYRLSHGYQDHAPLTQEKDLKE